MSRKRLSPATLGEWYRCNAKRTSPTVHICPAVRVSSELSSNWRNPGTRISRAYVAGGGATPCPVVISMGLAVLVLLISGRVATPRRYARIQA